MTERYDDSREDPLCFASVDQLATGYRTDTFSPVDVVQAMYARIA